MKKQYLQKGEIAVDSARDSIPARFCAALPETREFRGFDP
jgi:hypothetical protein